MKGRCFKRLLAASLLLGLMAPGAALALDLIVEHAPTDPSHFTTIQLAIDHAQRELERPFPVTTNFRILVKASDTPYAGPITPISNVPIIGESTAGTFIEGGSATLVNLQNVTGVTIRNFTFRRASIGISVANSSSNFITNNAFHLGRSATAVQVRQSPVTSIINNTFYDNGTGINTDSNVVISNDIFSRNGTAIATQLPTTLSYSYFFGNEANGVDNLGSGSIPDPPRSFEADPLFVAPASDDFHLQPDSPARNKGNPNYPNSFDSSTFDMGAYGGPNSDRAPSPITGVASSLASPTSIRVSWNPTSNGAVTGYRLYYGTSSGDHSGNQAAEGASPIAVPVASSSTTLSNLPVTAPAVPAAPASVTISPLNQALQVSWSAVPGATGYRVYRSTASFDASTLPATFTDVEGGATTSTQLAGLENGTHYFVAVSALAQEKFFLAVTAVLDGSLPSAPGSDNESPYSQEISQGIGPTVEGAISSVREEFPEAVAPFPNLPGKGCFIATAAYGFYSAPQVQVLRQFRDRYLMNNTPGRAFVAWYYRYGPLGARFINAHPWLKFPVRLALFPLIVAATFLLKTAPALKMATLFPAALLAVSLFRRREKIRRIRRETLAHTGGTR